MKEQLTTNSHIGSRTTRNPLRGKSGVYCITHEPTGLYYIGSAGDLGLRWNTHRFELRHGGHINPKLQSVFTRMQDITFRYLQTETVEEARTREWMWIKAAATDPLCVNYTGTPPTASTRAKLSKALKGVPKTPEHSRRISEYYRTNGLGEDLMAKLKARTAGSNPNAKGVVVDGVEYPTGTAAARDLGLARSVFQRRLESSDWPTYRYAT